MQTITHCEFIKAEKDGSLLVVSLSHYSLPGQTILVSIEEGRIDSSTRATIDNLALDGRRFEIVCENVRRVNASTLAAVDGSCCR